MIFFDLACILRANCCNRIFMTVVFLPYSMNSLIFVLSITPRIMKYPIGIQSFEQLIEDEKSCSGISPLGNLKRNGLNIRFSTSTSMGTTSPKPEHWSGKSKAMCRHGKTLTGKMPVGKIWVTGLHTSWNRHTRNAAAGAWCWLTSTTSQYSMSSTPT